MSPIGTSRQFAAAQQFGRFRSGADIDHAGHRAEFMSTWPSLAKGADVSRNVLNGPGRHENTADDRRRPCPFKPRRLYLLFRSHAMHAVVHARADLENALRSTAAVVEQNDHVGPLPNLDGHSLPPLRATPHALSAFLFH